MNNMDSIDNMSANLEFTMRLECDLALTAYGAGNYKTGYTGIIHESEGDLARDTHGFVGTMQLKLCLLSQCVKDNISTYDFIDAHGPKGFEGIFDAHIMC